MDEDIVCPLALSAHGDLAAHDHLAVGERVLPPDLHELVPARRVDRRRDVLVANLGLVEVFLAHAVDCALTVGAHPTIA